MERKTIPNTKISLTYERLIEICQAYYNNPREPVKNLVRDHEWQIVEKETTELMCPTCQVERQKLLRCPKCMSLDTSPIK